MQAFLKTGKISASDKPSLSGTKPTKKKPPAPWVEKYRPKTIDDIVDQGEVVQVLRECLSGGDLPHLLFYGPPGTGKTSAILAAARQLFGDISRDRVLELNASDERGIQVIRDKVKSFAQLTVSGTRPDGRPCPPYKLVILDEADSMTTTSPHHGARDAHYTLFSNLQLRVSYHPADHDCSKFRFKPLARENVIMRLREICESEGVEIGDGCVLEQAVGTCEGDLRGALTALQCCQRLLGEVTAEGLVEVTGLVPEKLVNEYLAIENYGELEQFVDNFLMEAYSASQLLEQASAVVVCAGHIKVRISEKLAGCAHRLQDGGAEAMQLADLGCAIIMANNDAARASRSRVDLFCVFHGVSQLLQGVRNIAYRCLHREPSSL